jgi:hypothetical protein
LLPYLYIPWAAAHYPVVNWEEVTDWASFFRLVLRKAYGSGQLVSAPEFAGGSALDRLIALFLSFGPLFGTLVIAGLVEARQNRRWYFNFGILALAFSGVAFVAYANVNLDKPTGLFVLERFFLLAHVVAAPFAALGLQWLAQRVGTMLPRWQPWALPISAGCGLLLVGTLIAFHYRSIDQSENHIARHYAEDILASVEPGTILFAAGDDAVLALLYLQIVEHARPDVPLIAVSLIGGDWYLRQWKRRFPQIAVPFDHYDGVHTTLKQWIDANPTRRFAQVNALPDSSLDSDYWVWRRGLIFVIEPMSKDVHLAEMAQINTSLLGSQHIPSAARIKPGYDPNILANYARTPMLVGKEYEKAGPGSFAVARRGYERALAIDPSLSEAKEGLDRLARGK